MSNPPTMPLDPNNIPGGALASLGGDQAAPINPAVPPVAPPPAPAKPFTERFFDAFNSGAGPKQTITVDPNTGAVSRTSEPGRPADWARNILSSAMAALGSPNAELPPGASGRGAAIASGYNAAKTANDQQVQKANAAAGQNQEEVLKSAEEARQQINSVIAQHKWDMEQHQFNDAKVQSAVDAKNIDEQLGVKPLEVGGVAVPEFKNTEEAMSFINQHPDAFHKDYTWRMTRDPDTNQVKVVERPLNFNDRMDREVTYADGSTDVLKNATGQEAGEMLKQKNDMLKTKADLQKENTDPIYKMEKDPGEMTGDKAVSSLAFLNNKLTDPSLTPTDKVRVNSLIKQANESIKIQEDVAKNKKKAEQAATEGDAGTMGEMLYHGDLAPSELPGRFRPEFAGAALRAANELSMKETGKPYNAAKADAQYSYAHNPGVQTTLNMISAMKENGGSLDIATDAAKKLPKMDLQTANKVFNAFATEFGSSDITNFHTAMLGLADEYAKVMGGSNTSDNGRQQSLNLLQDAYSKGQLAGAVSVMRRDIDARLHAMVRDNPALISIYGDAATEKPPVLLGPPAGADTKVFNKADGKYHWGNSKTHETFGPVE